MLAMYWWPDCCPGRFNILSNSVWKCPWRVVSKMRMITREKVTFTRKKVTVFCVLLCFECYTFTFLLLYFWKISVKITYLCGRGSQLGTVFGLPGGIWQGLEALLIVMRWSGNIGGRGTTAIGRSRDTLLNILKCVEEAPQQRIIQSKMSVVWDWEKNLLYSKLLKSRRNLFIDKTLTSAGSYPII